MWWLWYLIGCLSGSLASTIIFLIKLVRWRAGTLVIDHSADQPEIFLELSNASKLELHDIVAFDVQKRDYVTRE